MATAANASASPVSGELSKQDIARLLKQRRLARGSIHEYIPYIRESGHPDFLYDPAMHHWVMIDAFERLMRGEFSTLLVLAPRGSAKSTMFSVMFATWALANAPHLRILACSNTTELAEGFNRRRRSVAMTDQWKNLAGASLDPDNQGLGEWGLLFPDKRPGGAVRAGGVGSSIIGFRADLLILDDPIRSHEEAMSATTLQKHWDWWNKDAQPCLKPHGKTVVVSTRWSANDIPGRILKDIRDGNETDCKVVRLPMECDDPENDPLGRTLGGLLWEEWYTPKQIAKGKSDPRNWSCMYQQKPLDEEGEWLGPQHLPVIDRRRLSKNLSIFITGDLAMTVGRGDFSVISVWAVDTDRTMYLIDMWRDRTSPDVVAENYFRLIEQWQPYGVYLEDDVAFKVFKRLLMEMARARNVPIPLHVLPIRGQDKETRAAAFRGFAMSDRVRVVQDEWTHFVLAEANDFPAGAHDDIVDTMGLAGRVLAESGSPALPKVEKPVDEDLIEKDGVIYLKGAMTDVWDVKQQRKEFGERV